MLRNDLYRPWFLDKEKWGFEIISGEYKDVVVQIEKLDFKDTEEGNLDVEYHVVYKPEILSEEETKGDMFKTTFELIVNDIVREAIDTLDENTRNNNTKESDSQ
jgi:hypothetical protein